MVERHLTAKQVSEISAIATGTLAAWRSRENTRPNFKPRGPRWKRIGGRAIRYAESDVLAWLAQRESQPAAK